MNYVVDNIYNVLTLLNHWANIQTIYRQKDKIRDYSSMHCASPSYKKLMDEKLFYCSSPQKPEINTIKVEGGYHVNCSSYGLL